MSDKAIYSVDTVETITDNDKIYVNTGDNIKQIKRSDLFIDINSNLIEQGINLFDKTRITNGMGISNSTGGEYPDENVFTTDYIDVLIYKKIVCNRDYGIDNSLFGAFYDDNKSFVSGFLNKGKTIIIPSGVKYVRITFMNKQLDGLCIWNVNSAIGSVADEVSAQNESLEDYGLVNVFDGQWLQGGYIADGTYNSNYSYIICNKNKIPCNSGDLVEIKYARQVSWISTRFYDASGTVTEYKDESIVSNVSYKVPANTVALTFNIQYGSNESVTPNSALDCIVYVNNVIEQIKNDLGGLSFSASGTTLSITNGTNTWTLEVN